MTDYSASFADAQQVFSSPPIGHNNPGFDFYQFFDMVVNSSATTAEKLLALIHGRHIGRNGEAAYPSRARAIAQASVSVNTFQRSLSVMRLFFEVERRNGRATLYSPKPIITAGELETAIQDLRTKSTPQNGAPPVGYTPPWGRGTPQNGVGVHPKMGRQKDLLKDVLKEEECPNGHLASEDPKPPERKKGLKASEAAQMAFDRYNEIARQRGLPVANVLSGTRKQKIIARIKDAGGWSGFERAMANLEASAFLQGRNDNGFRADFDFICQAKSFGRLLDGGYGNGAHAQQHETYTRGQYSGKTI